MLARATRKAPLIRLRHLLPARGEKGKRESPACGGKGKRESPACGGKGKRECPAGGGKGKGEGPERGGKGRGGSPARGEKGKRESPACGEKGKKELPASGGKGKRRASFFLFPHERGTCFSPPPHQLSTCFFPSPRVRGEGGAERRMRGHGRCGVRGGTSSGSYAPALEAGLSAAWAGLQLTAGISHEVPPTLPRLDRGVGLVVRVRVCVGGAGDVSFRSGPYAGLVHCEP